MGNALPIKSYTMKGLLFAIVIFLRGSHIEKTLFKRSDMNWLHNKYALGQWVDLNLEYGIYIIRKYQTRRYK